MDIKDLKEIIKDLPDDMPIEFSTTSMFMTKKIDITPMYADDCDYVSEDTLLIGVENV